MVVFSLKEINLLKEALGYETALEMLAVRVDKLEQRLETLEDALAPKVVET